MKGSADGIELVECGLSKPLFKALKESEHAVTGIPLRIGGLVETKVVLPLHVGRARETAVSYVDIRGTERKVGRNRDGNALAVAETEAAGSTGKRTRGDGAVQDEHPVTLSEAEDLKGSVREGLDLPNLLKG